MVKIKYLGHSAFYIESNKIKALIDPFLNSPVSPIKADDITELDYIFVTHGHGDHIGSTTELAQKTGATVITCFELQTFFETKGIKTEGMNIGGRYKFPFGTVKMTPAWHGSSIPSDNPNGTQCYGGIACGYVIELDGKKIYHAGDTGLTVEMTLLEYEKIDIAMLPIGGYFTMDPEDALRAIQMIKPRLVIPMHYNTFPLIRQDGEEFKKQAEKNNYAVELMHPGTEIIL